MARRIKPINVQQIPKDCPPWLKRMLEEMIYNQQLREGQIAPGTNSRFVTIQDLVDAGIVPDGGIE